MTPRQLEAIVEDALSDMRSGYTDHDIEVASTALIYLAAALRHAAETEQSATTQLLKELREECRDWQDALSGEREGFDELCQRVDAVLAEQVPA